MPLKFYNALKIGAVLLSSYCYILKYTKSKVDNRFEDYVNIYRDEFSYPMNYSNLQK